MDPHKPDELYDRIILDDLDTIEEEREAVRKKITFKDLLFPGQEGDLTLWRRLFRFARPYLLGIIFCLILSSAVGLATFAKLYLVKNCLEPIVNPKATAEKVEKEEGKGFLNIINFFEPPASEKEATEKLEGEKADPSASGAKKESVDLPAAGAKDKVQDPPAADAPDGEALVERSLEEQTLAKNRLLALICAFLLLMLGESAAVYLQSIRVRSIGHRIVMDIRNALFARVMSLSMKFHNKNHSGKLISRLTNDLTVFGGFFTHTAVGFFHDIFVLTGCLIYMITESGWSFIGMIAILSVAFLPIQRIGHRIRRRDKITRKSTSLIYAALSESLAGQKIIKAFGTEDHEYDKFSKAANQTYRNTMKVVRLRSLTRPVVELAGSSIVAILMFYLGFQAIEGIMSGPAMITVVLALVTAIGPLRRLARANNNMQTAFASADRVATLLYSDPEIRDKPDARELSHFEEGILFDGVNFEHEENIPVLKNIDLSIRKGEKVALVGPSGSGKTTLADLVPRFFDVHEGRITLDGIDIRDLTLKSLRQQIGIVSQETLLFNDTVGANIAYGVADCSPEQIMEAARAANAHDFIMEMEEGYDTQIGERGVRLSGGQQQRLAIARAVLNNPPILILDEATSALDSESELQVQDALNRLMKGRTTLMIAHRLSTIREADKIVVMKEGRIVESGRHEELLAKGGIYTKLHELQNEGSVKE